MLTRLMMVPMARTRLAVLANVVMRVKIVQNIVHSLEVWDLYIGVVVVVAIVVVVVGIVVVQDFAEGLDWLHEGSHFRFVVIKLV